MAAQEQPADVTGESAPASAPVYDVPNDRIVSIEHPCIIRNLQNGLKSLGGEAQLKHVLEHRVGDSKLSGKQNQLPEPIAGVSLRPNDPFAQKLSSTGIETRNVLLKITVPKRTGRKRKRGSDEPFSAPTQAEPEQVSITALELLQRLKDNEHAYSVVPLGMLRETHRFRTLPDFQLRNSDLPIMQELQAHAMSADYENLKNFNIDLSPGASHITAFPGPPTFTSIDMAYKYEYQQAAQVVFVTDEQGQVTTKNLSAPRGRIVWGLPPDAKDIPQGPPPGLKQNNPTGDIMPRAIAELQKLLSDRPLVTKRVALNAMPPISDTIFKEATQFVGYSFKAGPWRDSLIKYGVDPRTDPKYRVYQTLMFQMDKEAFKLPNEPTNSLWARPLRHTRDDPTTHIFDGKSVTANGKTWQICDITDPLVCGIFDTEHIRGECDVYQWGWYYNGTMAKARTIMRDKMKYLFAGQTPPDDVYAMIARMPDKLTKDTVHLAQFNARTHGLHVAGLGVEVRNIAKNGSHLRVDKSKRPGATVGRACSDDEAPDADGDGELDAAALGLAGNVEAEENEEGDFGDMDERNEEVDADVGAERPVTEGDEARASMSATGDQDKAAG